MIHVEIRKQQAEADRLFLPKKGVWGLPRVSDPVPKLDIQKHRAVLLCIRSIKRKAGLGPYRALVRSF